MKLLTKEILKRLPALYATENIPAADKVAVVKFFTPDGGFTWYGVEYDPQKQLFFGYVVGQEKEWGYFSLPELQQIRGRLGLPIERDMHFPPTKMSELPDFDG